jgi:membrane-bound ClpP family serine protease
VRGEIWRARSSTDIRDGERVKIVGKEGPILIVEPIKEEEVKK